MASALPRGVGLHREGGNIIHVVRINQNRQLAADRKPQHCPLGRHSEAWTRCVAAGSMISRYRLTPRCHYTGSPTRHSAFEPSTNPTWIPVEGQIRPE